MGFFDGFVGGFVEQKGIREAETRAEADRASAQEMRIFEFFLRSPDKETRDLAFAGLLESAKPRKKKGGLRGWMGELEQSPILGQIRALSQKPVQTDPGTKAQPPSTQYPTLATPPPSLGEAPAGMAATSQVQPGAPIAPRPQPKQIPGVVGKPPTFGPRQMLHQPEDQIRAETLAREEAQTEAELARAKAIGFSPEEYKALERQKVQRASGGVREGNIRQAPDGSWVQDLYDSTGQVVRQIPAAAPGSTSSRPITTREIIAVTKYGKVGEEPLTVMKRLTPRQMGSVLEEDRVEAGLRASAVTLARANAMADAPLATKARFDAAELLQTKWQKVQAPIREMERQYLLMQTGLTRFRQGDAIGGSQAVLVTFQKILDPESVVRESEYDRSPSGLALKSRIQGFLDKHLATGGAGVPDAELAEMVETANQFLQGLKGWNDQERQRIEDQASEYGINPSQILGRPITSPQGTATQVGTSPPGAPTTPRARRDTSGNWVIDLP